MKGKLSRPATIKKYVDRFLATGKPVEYLRDIWYDMKGEIEHLKNPKHSEKEWDSYVNEHIGNYIFDLYLAGDFSIYRRLELLSQGLLEDDYANNTPMVIFTEKKTRTINKISLALRAAKYYSTGQIPHFECVNIADYLVSAAGIAEEVYLIGLTDYDPAGEIIFRSLCRRVEKILAAREIGLHLIGIQVEYGDSYEDITTKYKKFTLSTNKNNHGCQEWIKKEQPYGVEFNVIEDRSEHLERTILENIAPAFVKDLSEARVRASLYDDLLRNDKEYQELLVKQRQIEQQHKKTAEEGEANFTPIWSTPISFGAVKGMTTIADKH